ncbi:XRE family transcriptional regulator [Pseudonocardiaceae bacterium YIM PH 21723]|nr:XRE family transcriptional regulator [Pseudonocardiaceae bacterium YIM PH 21723]
MFDPERQEQERQDLAEALKGLRKAAGLSGERLAARCAISQSKISRIERGKTLPSVIDVQRILDALGVTDEVAKQLLSLARTAKVHYKSSRSYAEIGLWRKQDELKALAETSKVIRYFHPAAPSGMLQTRAFATQVLTPTVRGRPARNVERTVDARLGRQEVLRDQSRTFTFLMTEQAVCWQRAPRDVMAEQCRHLAAMSEWENVTIGIIPNRVQIPVVPLNTFIVYDERLVLVEIFSGEVVLRDPQDISYHLNLFDAFLERALVGKDAIAFLKSVAHAFMREHD